MFPLNHPESLVTLVVRMIDSSAISFGAYYTMTTSNLLEVTGKTLYGLSKLDKGSYFGIYEAACF